MEQPKSKEVTRLNLLLATLAVGTLAVAVWTLITDMFKAGVDDLFLVLTCLLLSLVFGINPLIWAYNNGWLRNPFKESEEEPAGNLEAAHMEEAHGGSNTQNAVVWGVLLGLTALEVFLAYEKVDLTLMLIILMGLSIVKAALIMSYFMHLKFERLSLILTIVPTLIVLLCLFAILFPDSFRIFRLAGK
ncbi:MAG TPA: cytochrome C oxidase subunit IV family protein [Blastocatellia bacterium]|nr:cytochrome C oxidase subunit IV family protein [Blastocatellia bacterium]